MSPYLKLCDKIKSITKEDACINFHDEIQPVYLETDESGLGLGAALLQATNGTSYPRDKASEHSIPYVYVNKSLSSTEIRYSNIEREALGILIGLEKFHHY